MSQRSWVVYGAGGQGKVLADAIRARGDVLAGFVDDDPARVGGEVMGARVHGRAWLEREAASGLAIAIGVGDNFVRERLYDALVGIGRFVFPPLVHPAATVATSAEVGGGTVVCARAVLNACARVGVGVIVNTGAIVEHDVVVGDFVHLSPASCLAGGVRVGRSTHIALGAIVLDDMIVGASSIVGAGSIVRSPIPDRVVAFGVPARIRRPIDRKEDT